MTGRVRVFIACSLDGFIAGPGGDLAWLPEPDPAEDYGYGAFMADTAAILMGRATYEVGTTFPKWPYTGTPVYVATARPEAIRDTRVTAVAGSPAELLASVRAAVGGNVYLDGGALIRAFLDAGLVDELIVTVIPVILGAGVPLFAGVSERRPLELVSTEVFASGLVQVRYRLAG